MQTARACRSRPASRRNRIPHHERRGAHTRRIRPWSGDRSMTEARKIRVLLADDHTLVRAGVRKILEAQPGVTVVGEVADGTAALDALAQMAVDELVLDLTMPGL